MNNLDNKNDEYETLKQEIDDYVLKVKRIRINEDMRINGEKEENKKEEEKVVEKEFEDITIPISNSSFPKLNENINIKLDKKKKVKNKDPKLAGLKLMLLMLLFIPSLLVLFIIGTHSSLLINKLIFFIIIFLLVITFSMFGYGLCNYIKNYKKSTKKLYNKLFRVLAIIFFSLYILGTTTFIVVLYGPSYKFRDWLVTTAMSTKNHQYLCKWFYSEAEIKGVQSRNYVLESGESTDPTLIGEPEEKVVYNEYEKQIMIHEKDEKYKIITFEVNGARAFLAAIYDPSMVSVAITQQIGVVGEYVTKMAERTGAILAINGGGFIDAGNNYGESPTGITIVDGKIITNEEYGSASSTGGGIIGITNENVLVLLKDTTAQQALDMGVRDAVSWGPFLVVNGVSSTVSGNGGWGGGARTAIGQRKDGTILFLVVESNATRTNGAGMEDLVTIMENYGAYNAANLDGGTSSVMALPRDLAISQYGAPCSDYFTNYACAINDPIDAAHIHRTRYVATTFIVTE